MMKLNARLEERVNIKEEEREQEERKRREDRLQRKQRHGAKIWMYYLTLAGVDEKEYLES
jgi:hypothetical protein